MRKFSLIYNKTSFRNFSNNVLRNNPYSKMTGAQIIYKKLLENDVNVTNGFSGGANLPLLDCFHKDNNEGIEKIKFITNSNEGNTGYVAEGYAKVSGKPGVMLVTSGPGLTNIITPLLDALNDGVPLIALSGQVPTNAPPDPFQGSPAIELTKPCTKWNYKLKNVEEIPSIMNYAFHIATSGRPGPVHIDCPKDLQIKVIDTNILENANTLKIDDDIYQTDDNGEVHFTESKEVEYKINDDTLKNVVELIKKSKKPILYVGQGCNESYDELKEFVDKTNIPVTTTLHALGCFNEEHKLALNMIGMHGHPTPNFMIQEADLILAIGSRFDDRTVGRADAYAPNAQKAGKDGTGGIVHVDIRKTENGKVIDPTIFINSDCKMFLKEINKIVQPKENNSWIEKMKFLQNKYKLQIPQIKDNLLSVQYVMKKLDNMMKNVKETCIYSTGVGIHQMVAAQFITWKHPRTMLSSGSVGTMGVSLGFAIGAKLANPDAMVISIDGDGSFNMTNTELKTVMDHQIPIKILLLNNNSEMMVEYWQKLFCGERYISVINNNCDYNKLADAYDIKNLYCNNTIELDNKIKEFIDYPGPILFHVEIEKTPCFPLVSPGKSIDNMILHDDYTMNDIDPSDGPPS